MSKLFKKEPPETLSPIKTAEPNIVSRLGKKLPPPPPSLADIGMNKTSAPPPPIVIEVKPVAAVVS